MRYGFTFGMYVWALLALAFTTAQAEILQNDSFAPGDEIAYFAGLGDQAEFITVLDGPQDVDGQYRVCRILLLIGPGRDFNIFTIRIGAADDMGGEGELIWQSDLDAFQIFASPNQVSAVDLAGYAVFTDAEQLRVVFRHVEGSLPQPSIATDTDGITPGRNQVVMFQRNGQWLFANTEDLDDALRPPGDWLVRVEVVGAEEACPNVDDPIVGLVDMGVEPDMAPPRDMAPARDRSVRDASAPRDAAPQRDAGPPRDMTVRLDQAVDAGFDFSTRPKELEITSIVPEGGTTTANTDVVITGRGFPYGDSVEVKLGEHRLFEATVLGGSTIKAIVPAGIDPGLYDLTVTRSDGQAGILPEAWTAFGDGLTLAEVVPNTILEGATPELALVGGGFGPELTVHIGGAELKDVNLEGPTSLTGTLAVPLTAGVYDVTLTRGELEVVAKEAFTVRRPSAQVADDCSATPGRALGQGLPFFALLILGLVAVRRRR